MSAGLLANRRPGQCADCGRHVAIGEGMTIGRNGRTIVKHVTPEHCDAAKEKQARETRERAERAR
jgi:hypothetical protein